MNLKYIIAEGCLPQLYIYILGKLMSTFLYNYDYLFQIGHFPAPAVLKIMFPEFKFGNLMPHSQIKEIIVLLKDRKEES